MSSCSTYIKKSNFAKHIINNKHYFKKGSHIIAYIEEFKIYKKSKNKPELLLNDQLNLKSNTSIIIYKLFMYTKYKHEL